MHILHTLKAGGAEMLVKQFIMAQSKNVKSVVVVLDEDGPIRQDLRNLGIPVHFCHRKSGLDLKSSKRIAKIAKRHHVNIIHAHQYTPFVYAAIAKWFLPRSTKLIFTEHGRHYPDIRKPKRVLANRLFLTNQADAITAVGDYVKSALDQNESIPAKNINVIHNGIDILPFLERTPDARTRIRQELDISNSQTVITLVGGFRSVKDHKTAVHTLRHLLINRHDAIMLFVGDGPTRHETQTLANHLRVNNSLRFTGLRRDIPDILQASDIAICTSLSEGVSVALIEAMTSQLPVVATDVGGNSEVVQNNISGLLAPRGDAAQLATHIHNLIQSPKRMAEFGLAGRERALKYFNQERMHNAWLNLYNQVRKVAA